LDPHRVWYDGIVREVFVTGSREQPARVQDVLHDPELFRARVREALAYREARRGMPRPGTRRAAVLMPLVASSGGAAVLLTKRTDTLERHGGQISFPGGGIEDGETALEAALRETSEEIGVPPEDVDVLGRLDEELITVSGFAVTPFAGVIASPSRLRLSAREVRAVLQVPIEVLLDPRTTRTEVWERSGRPRVVGFYAVGGEAVWGATARIIAGFLHAVFGAPSRGAGDVI
jgi:8-oxo-dGTP pyrophosphatase MutT (NUDIX family)